ncbi:MAG TPA: WD40 repeat domain-containing protein [Pirellulales bacterium]|nr:WD40 repeat domain-containing protein [Pirellulales bacterium]
MRSRVQDASRRNVVAVCLALWFAPFPSCAAEETRPAPRVDALGDPLPNGARLRLGTVRFRPPSSVSDLALSPDGKTLVSIGEQLIIWDTDTGKQRFRKPALAYFHSMSSYGCRTVCFAADGQHFYTPGERDDLLVWDLDGSCRQMTLKPDADLQGAPVERTTPSECRAIDVAGNGELFAYGTARGVVVAGRDGKILYTVPNRGFTDLLSAAKARGNDKNSDRLAFGGHFSFVRFSPDGKTLAVVLSEKPDELRLLEAATGAELRRVQLQAWMVRLDFSPDGTRLVTTERDRAVRLYDVATGQEVWSRVLNLDNPYENYTSAVAFHPRGEFLVAAATDDKLHLLTAATGEEIGTLDGHTSKPWALAFSTDGKLLYSSGWDSAIRRWDVDARKQLPLPVGTRGSSVVTMSPDGRTVAFAGGGGTLHLVSADEGQELRALHEDGMTFSQLRFSPDSRLLAAGGTVHDDVRALIFDAATGEVHRRWTWPKGADPYSTIECLDFTPDNRRLAGAVFRQHAAYLWDVDAEKEIAEIEHSQIYGLSFNPDGKTLATAGWDKMVRFWNADTGEEQRATKAGGDGGDVRMYTVCYSPAGDLLATAQLDGKVRLWKLPEMTPHATLQVKGRFVFGALSFSPDGLYLATGSMAGQVELWDAQSGLKVMDVGRHESYVYTLAFGHDNRTILSGGSDGVGYVWDLRRGEHRPVPDPKELWRRLSEDDIASAYQAVCDLEEQPDVALQLLGERLRATRFVMENHRKPAPDEEALRVQRLKKLLLEKPDSNTIRATAARRALALLARLRSPAAIALLKELADREPRDDLAPLAEAALKHPLPAG